MLTLSPFTFDNFLLVQCYYHTSFYVFTGIESTMGIVFEQELTRCFSHDFCPLLFSTFSFKFTCFTFYFHTKFRYRLLLLLMMMISAYKLALLFFVFFLLLVFELLFKTH